MALNVVRARLAAWASSCSEADADAVESAIAALVETWRRAAEGRG